MTVWHLSASLRMHLAHLASPAMLISLPAALSSASVEVAPANMAKPATVRTNMFLFIVFNSGLQKVRLYSTISCAKDKGNSGCRACLTLSDLDRLAQPAKSDRTPTPV